MVANAKCCHSTVTCLNQYELIRKYECASCGAVLMCDCDADVGRVFLPHQLRFGKELNTQRRVSVTHGFVSGICNSCRGIPEVPAPRSPMPGRTSKIRRYYWREIDLETKRRFRLRMRDQCGSDWLDARFSFPAEYAEIKKEVIEEIKKLHEQSPKYKYSDESQRSVMQQNKVKVVSLKAHYQPPSSGGRARVLDGNDPVSPEEFAARHYRRDAFEVEFLESRPIHALFGVLMWLLIQDPDDDKMRTVGVAAQPGQPSDRGVTWFALPEDFGTPGYGERRASAIELHLDEIPDDREELLWLFDYWLEPSQSLRHYLHVSEPKYTTLARTLVTVMPPEVLHRILKWLVDSYWERYCGWPDLLVFKDSQFLFAEVKSSKDKLSESQKAWIRGNRDSLGLPFELVKIHRLRDPAN